MNRENQKRIQLLADGELSHDDRRQFLAAIEQDSELWREIAVAFVEKQVLDGALGAAPAIRTKEIFARSEFGFEQSVSFAVVDRNRSKPGSWAFCRCSLELESGRAIHCSALNIDRKKQRPNCAERPRVRIASEIAA